MRTASEALPRIEVTRACRVDCACYTCSFGVRVQWLGCASACDDAIESDECGFNEFV